MSGADPQVDETVLELRSAGKSYAAIARTLGFERSSHAVAAFNRSLRRKVPDEQERLRAQEADRLQALTQAIGGNGELDDETRSRRLAAVDRMRVKLYAE